MQSTVATTKENTNSPNNQTRNRIILRQSLRAQKVTPQMKPIIEKPVPITKEPITKEPITKKPIPKEPSPKESITKEEPIKVTTNEKLKLEVEENEEIDIGDDSDYSPPISPVTNMPPTVASEHHSNSPSFFGTYCWSGENTSLAVNYKLHLLPHLPLHQTNNSGYFYLNEDSVLDDGIPLRKLIGGLFVFFLER